MRRSGPRSRTPAPARRARRRGRAPGGGRRPRAPRRGPTPPAARAAPGRRHRARAWGRRAPPAATSPAASSASASASASAKPGWRAEGASSSSAVSATARADCKRALRVGQAAAAFGRAAGDAAEEVVERADRAAEQRGRPREQLALDARDVRPARDDEHGIARKELDIAVEEARDLARIRGARDERETHRSMLVPSPDASPYAPAAFHGKSVKRRRRRDGSASAGSAQLALLGLRPRRATLRPPMPSASSSVTSSSRTPLRASR